MIRAVLGAVLLLHGLGHGGAIAALAWIRWRPGTDTGGWSPARTWLAPSLGNDAATVVAVLLWLVSLAGFVVTALSFWGAVVPAAVWRPLGFASAVVSAVGIIAFAGTWPMLNTVAALTVNGAVLIAVVSHWPALSQRAG